MDGMNKLTLLRAVVAISSLKICPIKEKLLDFGKKLDKLFYYFTSPVLSDHHLFETKHHSNINWVNPSLEFATQFATVWRL